MKKILAKFRANNVKDLNWGPENTKSGEKVDMHPVCSSDPADPNYSFSKATPSGDISLTITNPTAFGFFQEGQEYLIEFTPAT